MNEYFVTRSADLVFSYTVWRGTDYPFNCSIVQVTQTLRGARRLIRKDQKRRAAHPLGYPVTVYRHGFMPDLRESEDAP